MEEIRIYAFFDALGTREIMMGSDLYRRHALIDLIRKIEERSSCSLAERWASCVVSWDCHGGTSDKGK